MGLLDFLRRRADGPDAVAPAAVGPVDAGTGDSGAGTEDSGAVAEDSGAVADRAPDVAPVAVPVVVPPAWSLLPPLQPLSHQPIHRTFDTAVSASLRAHRRADQLLATAPLGHTVDPSSSGVVHGLLQATATDPVAPMTAGPDLVLRRTVLTASELPEADQAHPRWPAWVRSSAPLAVPSTPAPTGARPATDVPPAATAAPVPVAPVARRVDTDGTDGSGTEAGSEAAGAETPGSETGSAMGRENVVSSTMSTTSQTAVPTTTSGETAPARSLPLVPVAPVVSTVGSRPLLTRLADPAAQSLDRSLARSADVDRGPSGTTEATVLPLVAMADPGAPGGPSPTRLADPVQPSAVLRRRGIVEVPARRSPADAAGSTGSVGAPADATASRAADDRTDPALDPALDPAVEAAGPSVPSVANGASGPDGTEGSVGPGIARVADAGAPMRPTLGRGGLGQPLSVLPPTAVRRDADDAAFGGAGLGGAGFGGAGLGEGDPAVVGSGAPVGDASPFATAIGPEPGTLPLRRTADASGSDASGSAGSGATGSAPGAEGTGLAVLPVVGRVASRTVADGVADGVADRVADGVADGVAGGLADGVAGGAPDGPPDAPDGSGPGGRPVPAVVATLGDRPIVSSAVPRAPSVLAGAEPTAATVVVPIRRSPEPGSAGSAARSAAGSVMRRADASADAGSGGGSGGGSGATPKTARGVGWGPDDLGAGAGPVALARLADPSASVPGPGHPLGGEGPVSAAFEVPFDGSLPGADGFLGAPMRRLAATAGGAASSTAATQAVLPVVQRIAAPSGPIAFAPGLAPTYSIHSSWDGDRSDGSGPGADDGGSGRSLQRSADDAAPAGGGTAGGDPAGGGTAENPAAAAVQSPGGAPAGGSTAQADSDLDLLAGRLYERIRFRLRRELLDDRERAGLVLDRMR